MKICQQIMTLTTRVSRSFKVIGTVTDRSAADVFLLVFHRNYKPSRIVSEISGDICKPFHIPLCLASSAEGVLLGIFMTAVGRRNQMVPISENQKRLTIYPVV